MATFPAYVKLGWQGSGEKPTPVVARTEMDRGIAKQRRIAADAVVTLSAVLFFQSDADAQAFEDWFYSAAGANGGAGFFDFTSLRTGGTVSMRIVSGDIGELTPSTATWARSQRPVKFEYVRPAL